MMNQAMERVEAIVKKWDDGKNDYRGRAIILELRAALDSARAEPNYEDELLAIDSLVPRKEGDNRSVYARMLEALGAEGPHSVVMSARAEGEPPQPIPLTQRGPQISTPYVCPECAKMNKNWYAPCPHAPTQSSGISAGEQAAPGLRELVYRTADQLEKWASESIEGSWSTHQVVPMRKYAEKLRAALTAPVPREPCFTCEGENGLPPTVSVMICAECAADERSATPVPTDENTPPNDHEIYCGCAECVEWKRKVLGDAAPVYLDAAPAPVPLNDDLAKAGIEPASYSGPVGAVQDSHQKAEPLWCPQCGTLVAIAPVEDARPTTWHCHVKDCDGGYYFMQSCIKHIDTDPWHDRIHKVAEQSTEDAPMLRDAMLEWPECEEFYNLMQTYRHSSYLEPFKVKAAYEEVKKWLRTNLAAPPESGTGLRELTQQGPQISTPYVCPECAKMNKNWYAPCPHATKQSGGIAAAAPDTPSEGVK